MSVFWILILSVAVVTEAWVIYLLACQMRKERQGRLVWKRRYYRGWN